MSKYFFVQGLCSESTLTLTQYHEMQAPLVQILYPGWEQLNEVQVFFPMDRKNYTNEVGVQRNHFSHWELIMNTIHHSESHRIIRSWFQFCILANTLSILFLLARIVSRSRALLLECSSYVWFLNNLRNEVPLHSGPYDAALYKGGFEPHTVVLTAYCAGTSPACFFILFILYQKFNQHASTLLNF